MGAVAQDVALGCCGTGFSGPWVLWHTGSVAPGFCSTDAGAVIEGQVLEAGGSQPPPALALLSLVPPCASTCVCPHVWEWQPHFHPAGIPAQLWWGCASPPGSAHGWDLMGADAFPCCAWSLLGVVASAKGD